MASAVLKSAYCVKLRKPRCCCAFRSLRQLKVVPTKTNTTMTVCGTVSTFGVVEALPILRKEGKVVVPQSSSTTALFSGYKQILKFATEKFKSIIGIHGQHPPRIFNVIISYKRDDARDFVSHLKGALEQRGIRTFVDYILDEEEEILPAIEEVIKQSNIAVVVVSQNFHTSPWCLNELVKILECQKKAGSDRISHFLGHRCKRAARAVQSFCGEYWPRQRGFQAGEATPGPEVEKSFVRTGHDQWLSC